MTVIQAFILGIVQGLTEFLPISSSGHLVLVQKLLRVEGEVVSFNIAVHLATLLAVFIVFRKDLLEILKNPFGKMTWLIAVGTIPAVIFGLGFKDIIDSLFNSGATLAFEFVLTGLVMLYAERKESGSKKLEGTTYKDAFIIGTAQAIAILPAVSRSGFTISGALFRGLNRSFAAKFSFLLSIPAILGAAVLDFKDVFGSQGSVWGIDMLPLAAGVIAAGISGYLSIKFMLKILQKGSLKVFSYYVFALAVFVLIDQLFFGYFFAKLI